MVVQPEMIRGWCCISEWPRKGHTTSVDQTLETQEVCQRNQSYQCHRCWKCSHLGAVIVNNNIQSTCSARYTWISTTTASSFPFSTATAVAALLWEFWLVMDIILMIEIRNSHGLTWINPFLNPFLMIEIYRNYPMNSVERRESTAIPVSLECLVRSYMG